MIQPKFTRCLHMLHEDNIYFKMFMYMHLGRTYSLCLGGQYSLDPTSYPFIISWVGPSNLLSENNSTC